MPETTVDEHGHPWSSKHEICPAPQSLQWRGVNNVPKAPSMQLATELKLPRRVALTSGLHPFRYRVTGRGWSSHLLKRF